MTNIVLSIFATFLAAIAAAMILWFVQDAPASVQHKAHNIATLEASSVRNLCNFADCSEYPDIVASGNR